MDALYSVNASYGCVLYNNVFFLILSLFYIRYVACATYFYDKVCKIGNGK